MVQARTLKVPKLTDNQASVLRTLQLNPGTHITLAGAEGVYATSVTDTAARVSLPSVRRLIRLHYLQRQGNVVTLTEAGRHYGT